MADVLIDLGEAPRDAPPPVSPPPPPPPVRTLLGVLSLVLVALLAAAAAPAREVRPIVIPADLGASYYVADNLLFVAGGSTVVGPGVLVRDVRTYALPTARLLDSTMVTVAGAVDHVMRVGHTVVASYQLEASGDLAVVAVGAGTDRTLWRRPARLVGSAAGDLVLLATDEGFLAVEAATGVVRWTVPRPPDGSIAETGPRGHPRWLVVQSGDGRLETRDAGTGRVVAQRSVPRGAGNVWPVGDLVTIGAADGFSAYQLPGLTFRWRTEADLSQSWMQADCGTLICTFRQQSGIVALDRTTGRALWSSSFWAYAQPAGPYLAAIRLDRRTFDPAVWLLDPATGEPVGNFGRWEILDGSPSGPLFGKIDIYGEDLVYYGRLDPVTREIRVTGRAGGVSGNCREAAGMLICRLIDASVALWPLE
ncbi:PQQ-binding-like beta-propeller repeat protein [Actinoplanes sp. NPDC049596]|uniref:outer membrane protein assembly factor BamB family protein n=1 Tax=unclassified Actinoplanes TaxID=2626549 RepID=UPI00343E37B9